jgi:hypothetical protein
MNFRLFILFMSYLAFRQVSGSRCQVPGVTPGGRVFRELPDVDAPTLKSGDE